VLSRKRVDSSTRAFTQRREVAVETPPKPPAAPRSRLANLASELVVTYGPPSLNQVPCPQPKFANRDD
jgi:hypothetical protein